MKRLILSLLLTLTAATAAVGPLPDTAAASPTAKKLAPSAYMPAAYELPTGFVEKPGKGPEDLGNGLTLESREYYRNTARTGLIITVGVTEDVALAHDFYRALVAKFRAEGFTPEPLDQFADEAMVLVKPGKDLDQSLVVFRVGASVGMVAWIDQPGALTAYETGRQLGTVAGPMVRKMRESAPATEASPGRDRPAAPTV